MYKYVSISIVSFIIFITVHLNCCTILKRRYNQLPKKRVVITIDNGPNAQDGVTDSVLNVLKRHSITGYFSLIGRRVEQHPSIVQRIYDEGHVIVNHCYDDEWILFKRNKDIEQEIKQCNYAIGKALEIENYCAPYFRPPYGFYRPSTKKIWEKYGMKVVPITLYAWDAKHGKDKKQKTIETIITKIQKNNGGILILHDGMSQVKNASVPDSADNNSRYNRSWVPEALETIIQSLKTDGFIFTKLSE